MCSSDLKLFVQPAVAWFVASVLLGVDGHALLAIVVTSALPTAQNIFVHATRYDRATTLARTNGQVGPVRVYGSN